MVRSRQAGFESHQHRFLFFFYYVHVYVHCTCSLVILSCTCSLVILLSYPSVRTCLTNNYAHIRLYLTLSLLIQLHLTLSLLIQLHLTLSLLIQLGDTKLQLSKYLLKTLCTDMTNMMVSYVAVDNGHKIPEDTPTLNKVGVAYLL